MAPSRPTRALPCPDCLMRGLKGAQRIGNNRSACTTCNNFVQAVRRHTWSRMRDAYPEEFEKLRLTVELDLYPGVIDRFDREYPLAAPAAQQAEEV